LAYIQAGNPQQNAYIERYNRTLRYEWLACDDFESLAEVQETATQWLWTYNNERPHMRIGRHHPEAKTGITCLASTFMCA
jgi:putative transposase